MRIAVVGSSPVVSALSANLEKVGFVVTPQYPAIIIHVTEDHVDHLTVSGPDVQVTRLVAFRVGELAPEGNVLVATSHNKNDRMVRIWVPVGDEDCRYAVEIGVPRALDQLAGLRRKASAVGSLESATEAFKTADECLKHVTASLADHQRTLKGVMRDNRPWWKFW